MLYVTGDTYEIREQLKGLGCRWDEAGQCWTAPDESARSEGQRLADAEPWRKWREFYLGLVWAQGSFKKSTFEAAMNARSRGLPLDGAKGELRSHIVAAGAKPPLEWIERDVARGYEMGEPPRERAEVRSGGVSSKKSEGGRAWPSEWREEMRPGAWVTVVGAREGDGSNGKNGSNGAQPRRVFCSRFALRFCEAGAEVTEGELAEIQRLDAHLVRLRERHDAPGDDDGEELPKPEFDQEKLAAFSGPWRGVVDALWLCDRSPIDPNGVDAGAFLSALYEPGERVVVFDVFASQGQWLFERGTGNAEGGTESGRFVPTRIDFPAWDGQDGEHKNAPPLREGAAFRGSGPQGIWYLCNPVSGEFRQTAEHDKFGRPKWSRRFEEVVTSWRYFVFESDEADPREWMGAIVQMPLPIAAIYTSGGGPMVSNPRKKTSIHVLTRVDAQSKAQFDLWRETSKRVMIPLGADPGCMSAVRLTRLPSCMRELDKDGAPWPSARGSIGGRPRLQKLLFLDPAPKAVPLIDRPSVRDTMGAWERVVETMDEETDVASVLKGLRQWGPNARARELLGRVDAFAKRALGGEVHEKHERHEKE